MSAQSPLPESLFKEIAKLTRVDDLHYMQMRLSVDGAVRSSIDQWRAEQTDFYKSPLKPLVDVRQAARDLARKIDALDAGQMRMLQICLQDEDDDGNTEIHRHKAVGEYTALIDDLADAVEKAIEMHRETPSAAFGGPARGEFDDCPPDGVIAFLCVGDERQQLGTYPNRMAAIRAVQEAKQVHNETSRRRGGRPRGPRYPALQSLVGWLHRAIVYEAKGRLTYDRKMQKGSLVDVLELLRPYVDGGLIPDPLPWHVIEQASPGKTSKQYLD
jgi:hypothetical protein